MNTPLSTCKPNNLICISPVFELDFECVFPEVESLKLTSESDSGDSTALAKASQIFFCKLLASTRFRFVSVLPSEMLSPFFISSLAWQASEYRTSPLDSLETLTTSSSMFVPVLERVAKEINCTTDPTQLFFSGVLTFFLGRSPEKGGALRRRLEFLADFVL